MDTQPTTSTVAVIKDDANFKLWLKSKSRAALVTFAQRLNASCVGKRSVDEADASGAPRRLMAMLGTIAAGCDAFTPVAGEPRRYGSPKFREWHAFGNETRIDYGTGHEAAFLAFLYCLWRFAAVTDGDVDSGAVACGVFRAYVAACRAIQDCFGLEPAGARGVWALDPYQMLPFVFGSAQCIRDAGDAPAGWGDEDTLDVVPGLDAKRHESMFYECVLHVRDAIGDARFGEAAPILFNCSHRPWRVTNRRILRYFAQEVLGVRVVVQHMLFGDLFPADWLAPATEAATPAADDAAMATYLRNPYQTVFEAQEAQDVRSPPW
ncbi:phosphatase activator [Aureococcus anophagefferens]|nr:phosphatase activator [Aureococcus anophagefferens]